MLKTYTSQSEIQDLNRYVENLPITLENYKYMKDEDFILISEYIQITENIDDNRIDFNIQEDDTQFRIYLESGDLLLNLK